MIERMDGKDRVSQWTLSHICCANEVSWVYIPHPFTFISTHSEKVWWGLWVFGLHENITSLEPGTTCQAPLSFGMSGSSTVDEDKTWKYVAIQKDHMVVQKYEMD